MLLSKQPGDTGVYATATSSQVRLYYVLDRVFPLASSDAAIAKASGALANDARGGWAGTSAFGASASPADIPPGLLPYFDGAPACVPREHLRMLCRLSTVGGGAGSVAATMAGGTDVRIGSWYDTYGLPPSLAMSAAHVRSPSLPRTGAELGSATYTAPTNELQQRRQSEDASSVHHWGTPLIPFHTVPCDGAGERRLLSSHGGANASPPEWTTTTLATTAATSTFAEECGLGQSSSHVSGNSAAGYSGYYAGVPQTSCRRAGGGGSGHHADSSTSAPVASTAPTALSLSCATDCLLFFVANAEGLSWIGRSDTTTLSPLRVPMSLQMRRCGTGVYGGPVGGGGGSAPLSTPRPPLPFSGGLGAPASTAFPTHSFASSERVATPPNAAGDHSVRNAALMSDEDENDDEGAGADGAGEAVTGGGRRSRGGGTDSSRLDSLTGAAGSSCTDGLDVLGGVAPAGMEGLPVQRAVSCHKRVVTASGWDPRNSAILALGRQSGAVQLLDVEYMAGAMEGRCCSPTATNRSESDNDTTEPFFMSAAGGVGAAGASVLGGGGARLAAYAGADHLTYSVVQHKQMLGPVTALDWMPQSHLTVVAARRRDGLGFYAELLDLRASHDGVTYLGAPPEVFGVPIYARTTDSAAPYVLCSAEKVACHPSQRYVATVGTSRSRDIVQLWDVRMATRPVACQVYARAGYTSLCWSATEAGVVLGTTRDGGLRAHAFKELVPSRSTPGGPVVVTSHHYSSAASPRLSSSGFGFGGAGVGGGVGRSRRRPVSSSGPPHQCSTSGGEQDADRWGVSNSNLLNSGCSGTEAEDDFVDDSSSFRSGFSGDGTGIAALPIADRSNALVHVRMRAQSALECRLPSRVPAAAVGWVCRLLSEPAKMIAAGGIPGLAQTHRRSGSGMPAARPRRSELLHTLNSVVAGPHPTDGGVGDVNGCVMAHGCRTDLPQLLLLNAKDGELYTQVYNPGGSTVTSLSSSTALVAAGPNAFLTHASTAYKRASYLHEESVLDRLECQAAAAADAAAGIAVPCGATPISSRPGSVAGTGMPGGCQGVAGAVTVVSSASKPRVSGDSVAEGVQLSSTGSSVTGGGGACGAGGGGGVSSAVTRLKGRPVDLIGMGLLDEVEDEEDEEDVPSTVRANAAATATGDYEHRVTAGVKANGQPGFGAAHSTVHGRPSVGAAGAAGAFSSVGAATGGVPRAGLHTDAESALAGIGGAAAPKGVHRSGPSGDFHEEESLGLRFPLRETVAVPPHSRSASQEPMPPQSCTDTTSVTGRDSNESAVAVTVPQEMSFCEFHRLDRTRHVWGRLRSGFACDPLRNLTVLLREGVDREAYATFLYGCCAALLLFPTSVVVTPKSRSTSTATGPAASSFSLVLGLNRAVPGLLELLVSERELRQHLGLSDSRLSPQFRLSQHHQQLAPANATTAGEAAGFTPPSGHSIIGPVRALALQGPLLSSLPSSPERHKGPPAFPLRPFGAAVAGICRGRPPPASHLTGPAINAGVSRAAPSRAMGGAASSGATSGAAGDGAVHRSTYPIAIGMLRQLVLQSMGWMPPPAVCLVDLPAEHTPEGEGICASAGAETDGEAQATRSSPLRGQSCLQHPAEKFFVQGDGIGQHSLQEALERRVAVLVLLDRLQEASELLALYGTYNALYPSIALTLSGARNRQTTLMSLAADDCSGVTFWIHLMLTYVELVMRQQSCGAAAAGDGTLPADAASLSSSSIGATSSATPSTAAATESASRFDVLFTLPQQKAVVLRLLKRYPRLVLSDKVALATTLLLPPRYHSGHLANLIEVFHILVQQQYRSYGTTVTTSTADQQSVVGSAYASPPSTPPPPEIGAQQQRRMDAQCPSSVDLPPPPAESSSVGVAVLPATLDSNFPSLPGVSTARGRADTHGDDPIGTFVLTAAASADRFAPISGCSLLLVTVVEGISTDCSALQRYVDESSDVQASLSYAAAFGDVLSPTVRMWRDAYRRLLNDQGLAMWRSQHDLQIVKLVKAREEAEMHGSSNGISGHSSSYCGGVDVHSAGAAGAAASNSIGAATASGGGPSSGVIAAVTTRGGGGEGAAGAPSGGPAPTHSGGRVSRPNRFPGALGARGGDLGAAPGVTSAAALMSTQTVMMMERTLNRFAQTTATTTADRDRSLREATAASGGAIPGGNEVLHRTVELRCNCGQAMHATAPSKSSISSMTSTNMTRKQLIPCGNPECRQWQSPMCTVCGERMEHRATELPPERFFAWCSVCLHGGHWCHLREWFSKHTKCPVENCPCHCCDNVHLS
ncbi:hypothetical protein LSCM4_04477 [Leishmania orientalis]|uniref:Uncharacterized protein n=1 Tax=Leishmania orientalis TaxID=2249476 RepID=A0A836KIM3_9TRYP|nr:hypothetical protein LSCM4_04477 [Leishmania orientalis]